MPDTIKGFPLHRDSPDLTYHSSVSIPDIVPLVVDFNDEAIVGRAEPYREGLSILANIYADKDVLDDEMTIMMATQGTTVFASEDGTTYAIYGGISQVSLVTPEGNEYMRRQIEADEVIDQELAETSAA